MTWMDPLRWFGMGAFGTMGYLIVYRIWTLVFQKP